MDIYGWDAVWVCTFDAINAHLSEHGANVLPEISTDSTDCAVRTDRVLWRLGPASVAGALCLHTQALTGTLRIGTGPAKPLTGVTLDVTVNAALLQDADGTGRLTAAVADPAQPSTPLIAVRVNGAGPVGLSAAAQTLMADAIAAALLRQIDAVTLPIATINPLQYLTGTGRDWAVQVFRPFRQVMAQNQTREGLAIYMGLAADQVEPRSLSVDPRWLDVQGKVGFVMSQAFLLQCYVWPLLTRAMQCDSSRIKLHRKGDGVVGPLPVVRADGSMVFPVVYPDGTNPLGFHVGDLVQSDSIQLYVNEPLKLGTIRVGLLDYQPVLTHLCAAFSDNALNISFKGTCDMHLNITAAWSRDISLSVAAVPDKTTIAFTTNRDEMSMTAIYDSASTFNVIDNAAKNLIVAAIESVKVRLKASLHTQLASIDSSIAAKAVSFAGDTTSDALTCVYTSGGLDGNVWFRADLPAEKLEK